MPQELVGVEKVSQFKNKNMNKLQEIYEGLCSTPSDINEHLPTLKKYAEECEHITEMGVRWVVSTYALLMGNFHYCL